MLTFFPILIMVLMFGIMGALRLVDKRKERPHADLPRLTFVIPCYNDIGSIGETLDSIYDACGHDANIIVIDDCSTDGSREALVALSARLGFTLRFNSSNIGKSKTLNEHFHLVDTNIVVFVDADVRVNRQSLDDAIARLRRPAVGAVSCPYRSANPGFLPMMQSIEYNMLAFIQGAYNVFSTIALWGGFIAVKRDAFLQVKGFTLNAITEDMDLAFKLKAQGWRCDLLLMEKAQAENGQPRLVKTAVPIHP
jgi:biofilm PGA synthesis N-glycosyltransferase PgaC